MSKKEKKPRAKAPNKTLEATFNGNMAKGFTDLRDIILSVVNSPDDDPKNIDYVIPMADYTEQFGFECNRETYKKIRNEIARHLRESGPLSGISELGNEVLYFPFQEIEFDQKNMALKVVLGRRFKQVLVDAKESMTYYSISYTLPMKSKYSKIMLPRLLEHERQPKMEFRARGSLKGQFFTYYEPIDQFREKCGIPKSYKLSHIKNVCDKIISEIEQYTDYTAIVFYNNAQVPGSKKPSVTHIAWNLTRRKKKAKEEVIEAEEYTVSDPNTEKELKGSITIEDWVIAEEVKTITGLDESKAMDIAQYAREHGRDQKMVSEICQYAISQRGVENLVAYIKHGILRGGYDAPVKGKSALSSDFNNFEQRSYDYSELEKELYNR